MTNLIAFAQVLRLCKSSINFQVLYRIRLGVILEKLMQRIDCYFEFLSIIKSKKVFSFVYCESHPEDITHLDCQICAKNFMRYGIAFAEVSEEAQTHSSYDFMSYQYIWFLFV